MIFKKRWGASLKRIPSFLFGIEMSLFLSVLLLMFLHCACSTKKQNQHKKISLTSPVSPIGLRFEKVFSRTFEMLSYVNMVPCRRGILVLRSKGALIRYNAIDFAGKDLTGEIECEANLEKPDRLSSIFKIFYDVHTDVLYNIKYPYLKKWDLDTWQVRTVSRFPKKARKFPPYLNLYEQFMPDSSCGYFIFPFSDMMHELTEEKRCFGIIRFTPDFSQWKILDSFKTPIPKHTLEMSKTRLIITNFFRGNGYVFPVAAEHREKKVFFAADIYQNELTVLNFDGKKEVYDLQLLQKTLTINNEIDEEVWYQHNVSVIGNLKYKARKENASVLPYIYDLLVYKKLLLIVTPVYREPNRSRLAYALDTSTLQYRGEIDIPVTGTVRNAYIFNDYYIEDAFDYEGNDVRHRLTVYRIFNSPLE